MLNVKSSVMLAALTLTRMLTALGIAKAVAVTHGSIGVGLLGHLQGITGFMAGFLAAPLGNGLIRAVTLTRGDETAGRGLLYWREALRMAVQLAAFATLVIALFHAPLMSALGQGDFPIVLLLVAIVAAPFQALTTAFQSLLNGLGKLRELSLLGMAGTLLTLAISVFAIWAGRLDWALTWVLLAVSTQTAMFVLCFRSSPWLARGDKANVADSAEIKRDIRGFAIMAIATALLIPGAQIFIRTFLADHSGWDTVGYWQAAQRLSDAHLSLLGTILSAQLLPRLVQTGQHRAASSIAKGMLASSLMLLPGALILMLLGGQVVELLFSAALQPAKEVLKYQVLADLLRALSWPASYFLIAQARLRSFCIAEAIFASVWVSSTFALAGHFGWAAASMGYLAASALSLIFLLVCVALQLRRS